MTYAVTGAKPIKVWSPSFGALIVLCARSVCSLISQLCQPDVGVRSSTYGTAKLRWPWSKTEMDRGLQNRYSSGDQVKSDELDVNKKHGEKFSWNCNTSIYSTYQYTWDIKVSLQSAEHPVRSLQKTSGLPLPHPVPSPSTCDSQNINLKSKKIRLAIARLPSVNWKPQLGHIASRSTIWQFVAEASSSKA